MAKIKVTNIAPVWNILTWPINFFWKYIIFYIDFENAPTFFCMFCGLASHEQNEILGILIDCFKRKEDNEDGCHKQLFKKLKSYRSMIKSAAEMAGGGR